MLVEMANVEKCESCGMQTLYISWSQLKHHEQCRQKAHLLRTGKRDPQANIRMFFPGTVVDRTMRAWLMDENRQPGQMAVSVRRIMAEEERLAKESGDGIVKWKSAADKAQVLAFCVELVNRLEPILIERVLPKQFEPSKRFKVPLTVPYLDGTPVTIYLVGEMDLLLYEEDGTDRPWDIYDLKATKNDSYWRSTMGQLVFYDVAIYVMFHRYTRQVGLIQPMCKQPVVSIQVTDQQRVEMMQRILAMCNQIWKKDFALADTSRYCYTCAAKRGCSRFQPIGGKMQLVGAGALEAIPMQMSDDALFDELLELG